MLRRNFPCQTKGDFHIWCQFMEQPETIRIRTPKKDSKKEISLNTAGFKFQIIPYHATHISVFFLFSVIDMDVFLCHKDLYKANVWIFSSIIWVSCSHNWIRILSWGHSILLVFASKSLEFRRSGRYLQPWISEKFLGNFDGDLMTC